MKEFDIEIKETLEKIVTVEAESKEEAMEKVQEAYYNSEYILDSEDFTGVDFSAQTEREIEEQQKETMDVLLVKSGMYPQQIAIGVELEDLQAVVGGNIEATYPFEEEVALIMNEEGKLNGSELNRSLRHSNGEIYDIVAGDFLVVGLTEDDFGSLSPELMKKFESEFHQPESFIRMGKSMMAIPVPDDKVKKEDAPIKADAVPHKAGSDRDSL